MPCHFTGIFYIQSGGRNLSTYFFDEIRTPRQLTINYFSDISDTEHSPFPEVHHLIVHDRVYLITGFMIHQPSGELLVTYFVDRNSDCLVATCYIDSYSKPEIRLYANRPLALSSDCYNPRSEEHTSEHQSPM